MSADDRHDDAPLPGPAWPVSELTAEEKKLLDHSTRWMCLLCPSQQLRPLVLLARENPASFVYNHDAIFGCDLCHGGYAEVRRHDSFDWDEVHDQDEHHPLDAESIALLRQGLLGCPHPLSETCNCPAHESLRASWAALPSQGWEQYNQDIPRPLIKMADPDQARWSKPGARVKLAGGLPKLESR
jgi:hypothetical protein